MASNDTTRVSLTDAELVLLDGHCSDPVQKEVDSAKRRVAAMLTMPDVPPRIAKLVSRVVDEATSSGMVVLSPTRVSSCDVCGRDDGYYPYARSSRYHRKGEPNYSNRKYFHGYDLAQRFIVFNGMPSVGGCAACVKEAAPHIVAALKDVRCEVSPALTGEHPAYYRLNKMKCDSCGWEGHEGQMGSSPALMGGSYAGKCPACPAENILFSTKIKTTGRVVVPAAECPSWLRPRTAIVKKAFD